MPFALFVIAALGAAYFGYNLFDLFSGGKPEIMQLAARLHAFCGLLVFCVAGGLGSILVKMDQSASAIEVALGRLQPKSGAVDRSGQNDKTGIFRD